MYSKIIGLFLLLSISAQAALIPTAPTLTACGRVFTDLSGNLIVLIADKRANTYSTLRLETDITGTGYVVPGGKTLRIQCAEFAAFGTTVGNIDILYGDNDVGWGSSSAPTTAKYMGGGAVNLGLLGATTAVNGAVVSKEMNWTVPTGKYPAYSDGGASPSSTFWAYGYLE